MATDCLCLFLLQLAYTKTNDGAKHLRKFWAPVFGLWHLAKMAMFLVYKHFAYDIFAPLFHFLIPGHEFYIKPSKLRHIEIVFTRLRLAYDRGIAQAILSALGDQRCNTQQRNYMWRLRDLCTYIIPAVSWL
jgi:hypothetical protein